MSAKDALKQILWWYVKPFSGFPGGDPWNFPVNLRPALIEAREEVLKAYSKANGGAKNAGNSAEEQAKAAELLRRIEEARKGGDD